MSRTLNGVVGVVGLVAFTFTGSESIAQNNQNAGASAPATPTMVPAHFEATVYEVQTTPEQASSFDGKTLAAMAETAETLLKALSEKGKSRILYRIDQPVNVASERIQIGAKEQVVTGTRLTQDGKTLNSIRYQNVGVIIQLSTRDPAGEPTARPREVSLSMELSALTESEKELAPGVKTMTPRSVAMAHSEPLQFARPLVALSVSSASAEDQAAPLAYVIRYRFSAPVGK